MQNNEFLELLLDSQIVPLLTSYYSVSIALIAAFIIGVWISFVYRLSHKGFSYEETFNITVVLITVLVTVIMMTIGSNLALSLGLIGSLSIIRFRTPIKNTVDMSFLLWAIASGLAIGAGRTDIAVVALVIISMIVLFSAKLHIFLKSGNRYILTLEVASSFEDEVLSVLDKNKVKWRLLSSFRKEEENSKEMNLYVYSTMKVNIENSEKELSNLKYIKNVSLMSPETNLFV
jgi:hypothetical protein